MLEASIATAFLGGVLTLLSPCSALLLPAFFAYSSQSSRALVAKTATFTLGLILVLVPLGVGASGIGQLFVTERAFFINLMGGIIIAFGVWQLVGSGFRILPAATLAPLHSSSNWFAPLGLGALYGFAGFCSGPILGAILTMAAAASSMVLGGSYLAIYALGMSLPLFLLAFYWKRLPERLLSVLKGKRVKLGTLDLHMTQVTSALIFIAIGAMFIAFEGTTRLSVNYDRLGLTHLSEGLESLLYAHAALANVALVLLVLTVGSAWWLRRLRKQNRSSLSNIKPPSEQKE